MTLRNRVLSITIITILILTGLLYAVEQYAWRATYTQIEELGMRKDVARALNAIDQSLENMESVTRDWSAWDDTYEFINTRDQAYIESNLTDETLSNLQINLVLYQDEENRLVYGELFDLEESLSKSLPPGLQDSLNAAILAAGASPLTEYSGVVSLPGGAMLVVSMPILDSDRNGPSRGSLVFGRYFDADFIAQLEELTQLDLAISPLTGSFTSPFAQTLSAQLQTPNEIRTRLLDDRTIDGYTLISDAYDHPVLLLEVRQVRQAFVQGINGIRMLVLFFILAGLLSGLVITLNMEHMVLNRVTTIGQHVDTIAAHGDPSLRIHIKGKDELSQLAQNINQMLDSLNASQEELLSAHEELELRNQVVMETNQALQNEIHERGRVERDLQARTHQQERLIDTARQLTASLDVRHVLEAIARSAREILKADGCSIYLLEQDGRTLTPVVAIGEVYEDEILSVPLDVDQSFTGRAVIERRGLIFNDAGVNPSGCQIPGTPEEEEERVIVAPFIADDQVLGAMCLDRNQSDFLEEELALAETFAAYASTALKNAQAHDRLQREVEERRLAEAALRESEERYRSLVQNIPIGIYRTSPGARGQFLMANPAFLTMSGYNSEAELKSISVADMYDIPTERAAFSAELLTAGRIDGREMPVRRKDGSLMWGSVTAIVSTDSDGQLFFDCSMMDVNQHKQAEKVQEALYQISQATITASNLEELYGIVHRIIGELIMAQNFYVALYDPVSDILSFPYFVDEFDQPPDPARMGRRLTDYLIRLGQPLLLTPEGFSELIERGEIESYGAPSLDWLGVPLKTAENRTIGCMVVQTYDEGARYTEHDRELLTIISTQIALAIERKRSEKALQDQRAFLEQVIDINPNLIFAKDHDGRFILANQAIASLYGTSVSELIGKTEADFNPNFSEVQAFRQDDREVIHKLKEKFIPEEKVTDASGRVRWLQTVKRPLILESDQVHVLGVATDITERKYAEDQLTHNAFHDSLTGLPNRVLFMDRLQHAIQRSKRRKESWFAVLFLDLDRFKTVNDSLGHVLGDQLLIAAARRLQTCLRTSDTIARFGGDEFVILLEDLESSEDATRVAERILHEMTAPFTLAGHQMVITTSIGVVFSTMGYEKPEEVLRDADIAMYRAKEQGRRQYVVFNRDMRAYAAAHLELESDLRHAIDHNELELHYQPIFSVKPVQMIGFEALVRWRHPRKGLINPADFIPFAEETGLIIPLGRWVLHEACRQMHAWRTAFPSQPPLTVSVNLSNKQFSQPDFFSEVRHVLDETSLDPHALRLEITESVIMDNPDLAIDILNRLQSLGVEVHIDDFGTGYSSLVYLHMLPINAIKIDRSFISGSGVQDNGMEIIQTIIKLAHELKVDSIAEGVETQEQFDRLSNLDCEYAQGYLLSGCLENKAVEQLLIKQFQAVKVEG